LAWRYLTLEEQTKWPDIAQVAVAMDALAIIVNVENLLKNITPKQLSDLYCGF